MAYLFPYAGAERRTIKHIPTEAAKRVTRIKQTPKGRVKVQFVEVCAEPPPAPPGMREIMHDVCEYHNVSVPEIVGRGKLDHLIRARRDFIVRAKRAGYSFVRIGKALERDHSTCVHQFQLYKDGAPADPDTLICSVV